MVSAERSSTDAMLCLFRLRQPPSFTLFPYTTLFRSQLSFEPRKSNDPDHTSRIRHQPCSRVAGPRSEEHTSELQSRENLVCRLLLEKKKQPSPSRCP